MKKPTLSEAVVLIAQSQNALLDYVDRLEKQGGMMGYGRKVILDNEDFMRRVRARR